MTIDLIHHRLHNQHLLSADFQSPCAVIESFGAVQSQEYALATWSLAMRMQHATDDTIDQAFNDGDILRTHILRPTWHFVAPKDIRWMLALTAPRVHALNAYYYRQTELDDATLRQAMTIIEKALIGGQHLNRKQLQSALQQGGIVASSVRLAYIIMYAELEGLICSGPRQGKQFTYALLDEWVPPTPVLTDDEALAELVKRYFVSHGPATLQDFAWWSSLKIADAKRGIEILGKSLQSVFVDDLTFYFQPPPAPAPFTPPLVHLLQPYDEYTVSYRHNGPFIDDAFVEPIRNATYFSTVIMDGRVVGVWKRSLKKVTVEIEYNLFEPFQNIEHQAAFLAAAKRFGDFLGKSVVIV
jgi:hypothetical protein